MPFVLPLTDQDAENARLLDRLTKQQEINQSLRVENAQLKDWATTAQAKADKLESELADYKRIAEQQEKTIRELRADQSDTDRERKYCLDYIMGHGNGWQEFAEYVSHTIKGNDIGINWGWLEDDFNLFSVVYYQPDPITGEPIETKTTLIRDKNEIDDNDAGPNPEELEAHKEFFSEYVLESTIKSIEYIKVYDFSDSPREPTEVEKLKADLAMKDAIIDRLAKHQLSIKEDNRKTILEAKFETWREEQAKYNPDYNMEDEAQWLIDEATNIMDAVDIFNELYEEGGYGDESTWKLICDHQRKWQLEQLYMDEETGEYTLTEEEWQAQNQ